MSTDKLTELEPLSPSRSRYVKKKKCNNTTTNNNNNNNKSSFFMIDDDKPTTTKRRKGKQKRIMVTIIHYAHSIEFESAVFHREHLY